MRDRILQARKAGFPKEYEEYLESYYRRLAREDLAREELDRGSAGSSGDDR